MKDTPLSTPIFTTAIHTSPLHHQSKEQPTPLPPLNSMSQTDYHEFSNLLRISNQYKYLNTIRKELQGLYVLPRENDVYTWDGVLFVTSGVWEEGIFKFTLHISKEYVSILLLISQWHQFFHMRSQVRYASCSPFRQSARIPFSFSSHPRQTA